MRRLRLDAWICAKRTKRPKGRHPAELLRVADLRFEKAHGIAIGAAPTPPAERLHPKAANLPFRP